jgi:hypothetical protein
LAIRHRLPTVFTVREFVQAGGLMSYGGSYFEFWRRAAVALAPALVFAPADEFHQSFVASVQACQKYGNRRGTLQADENDRSVMLDGRPAGLSVLWINGLGAGGQRAG